jgi:hypothetical protein
MTAAPGVDHAVMIGILCHHDRTPDVIAMERQRAVTQDVVCASVAPTARAASRTTAKAPAMPTSAATKAAVMAERRIGSEVPVPDMKRPPHG